MEFAEVVRRRRMVRRYTGDPVDPAAVERILDVARRAPSAGFAQGQRFVVVTSAEQRARIAQVCGEEAYVARGFDPWVSQAPVHVIPCVRVGDYWERYAEPDKAGSTPPEEWEVPFWWVDGGASLMLVLLAAVDEGLAAGLLAPADGLRWVLGIPADVNPLGVVTIGHPAPDRRSASLARGWRLADEVVHRQRWGRRGDGPVRQ